MADSSQRISVGHGASSRHTCAPLPIGSRVRHLSSGEPGTVVSVPFMLRGTLRVIVSWDARPGRFSSVPAAYVILVPSEPPSVPPEARPYSVGAMAGGAR